MSQSLGHLATLALAVIAPTRDHPDYWVQRPADHNARGLFNAGPQDIGPSDVLAKLIGDTSELVRGSPSLSPQAARQHMADVRRRVLAKRADFSRFLSAVNGQRTRNRRAA